MVAAAFESLTKEETAAVGADTSSKPDKLDERIINAQTVAALLSVAEGNASVTRKHALKVNYEVSFSIPIIKFVISF